MDYDSKPYWDLCRDRVLAVSHCQDCGNWFWYPRSLCPRCLGDKVTLDPVAGTGELYTYVTRHTRGRPEPYSVAWVQLDEQDDLILAAGIRGPLPPIGARVVVDWTPWKDGFAPVFVAISEASHA